MSFSLDLGTQDSVPTAAPQLPSRISALISRAEDRERRRIARELHDGIGQSLTVLLMNLQRVVACADRESPQFKITVSESAAIAKQALAELRAMSYLLHPPLLQELGLTRALERYIAGFVKLTGIDVVSWLDHAIQGLSREAEIAILRTTQECLTNILRHSGSHTAEISLSMLHDKVVLEVKDQGKGIPLEGMIGIRRGESVGVGLRGIRERAKSLGGTFHLCKSGTGTLVRVKFPIQCGLMRPLA